MTPELARTLVIILGRAAPFTPMTLAETLQVAAAMQALEAEANPVPPPEAPQESHAAAETSVLETPAPE